jgi:hypothetical protein
LDLKTNKITEEKINELGTIEDYFTEKAEDFLCKNIEQPFGRIAAKVKVFEKKKIQTLTINKEESEAILRFFHFAWIRSEKILSEINKHSTVAQFLGDYKTEDLFILNQNFFSKYKVNILLNRTDINFVLPKNCFFQVFSKEKELIYILPFSPRTAFILVTEKEVRNYVVDGKEFYNEVHETKTLENLNVVAYKSEQQMDNKFIVSKTELELQNILDSLK